MVGSPLTGLPGAVQARGSEGRGRPFYVEAACKSWEKLGKSECEGGPLAQGHISPGLGWSDTGDLQADPT